jgi:hypothetical protein
VTPNKASKLDEYARRITETLARHGASLDPDTRSQDSGFSDVSTTSNSNSNSQWRKRIEAEEEQEKNDFINKYENPIWVISR